MPNFQTDVPGPVAWMIIDRDERIRGHSHALRSLIGSPDGALVGRSFGEASGCTNALFERSRCGQTSRCQACVLHRAVTRTRQQHAGHGPSVLLREYIIDGHLVERAWSFSTHTLSGGEPGLVLVTFEQLAHEKVRRLHPRHMLRVAATPTPALHQSQQYGQQPTLCALAG